MGFEQALCAVSGWLDLGLPDEALVELDGLADAQKHSETALRLRIDALMAMQRWNQAAAVAKRLSILTPDDPLVFLRAAYCLHETGDTQAACQFLFRGPRSLMSMPIFHYNYACYLSILGEYRRAKGHLRRALKMDSTLREHALQDRDLACLEVANLI